MSRPRRAYAPTLALVLLSLVTTAIVHAHDSGFGHSRRTLFVAAQPGQLIIEYRIAQTPDEALIEMTRIDRDGDGKISTEEKDRFFAARGKELAEHLHLQSDERVPLQFVGYELRHPLVQVFRFSAATTAAEVTLEDRNFPHKPGSIRIHAGDGVNVELGKPVDLNHAERLSLRIVRIGKK